MGAPRRAAPDIAGRLRDLAATTSHLPLYGRITAAAASDPDVVALLAAARPGQERPVLLLAALHDLVLRTPSVPAARWYPSVGGRPPGPTDDPWPDVRETLLAHAPALRSTIATRSTQTNEVNRSAYVAALLVAAAADVATVPVGLLELGCSAGLLLGLDRYHVAVGATVLGDLASPVRCAGSLAPGSTPLPPGAALPPIVERVGLDAAPVALSDVDEVRWLEACLWPDQPERLERFRAAVALLRPDPPRVVAGDLVADLPAVAAGLSPATHLVVLSSWALTYVRRDRRPLVASALAALAADGRPVTWITAEPPGAIPGIDPPPDLPPGADTVLALRRWRDAVEVAPTVLGTAHPHAAHLHLP